MRHLESNRLPSWQGKRSLGNTGRWTVTEEADEVDIVKINQQIEDTLLKRDVTFHRRYVTDTVGMVFHTPEDMIQIETLRKWNLATENAIEDAVRDAVGDYESDFVFTLVKEKK
jgi:hypothetical protein